MVNKMSLIRYILISIIGTFLRGFPMPCKTGLIKIGNPDRSSPVFLTGNFCLTIERVKQALKGLDCYLLIANSNGINVWCASAGGHLTNHDVINTLKTTRIEELVDHRNIILPQLAATGIDANEIKRATGWHVIWGPVRAADIKQFINNGFKKTAEMRRVKFTPRDRIEMAIMWAFPISIIAGLFCLLFLRDLTLLVMISAWASSLMIFLTFPLFEPVLPKKTRGHVPSAKKILLIFFLIAIIEDLILTGIAAITLIFLNAWSRDLLMKWATVSLLAMVVINLDLTGNTPTYKSDFSEDRKLEITADIGACIGCENCINVCPKNCYDMNEQARKINPPRVEDCVQCGACIVQCPVDALYFVTTKGEKIPPVHIRKYKLNMMGKRMVPAVLE